MRAYVNKFFNPKYISKFKLYKSSHKKHSPLSVIVNTLQLSLILTFSLTFTITIASTIVITTHLSYEPALCVPALRHVILNLSEIELLQILKSVQSGIVKVNICRKLQSKESNHLQKYIVTYNSCIKTIRCYD